MQIFVHDEFSPEAQAMLQALYSRSPQSVQTHIQKVREKGSAAFMQSYYVGYGHASIGDCGATTLFIENVSLLACKAIQDNPLYSGQETSTRYIDFSHQPLIDPVNSHKTHAILKRWIAFYTAQSQPLVDFLKEQYPLPEGEDARIWEKTVKARSFDILRSFLPAGVCSQLSWATNLRQAHENLVRLRHHPLAEVRDMAQCCQDQLQEKYPSSFSHRTYPEQTEYLSRIATHAYLPPPDNVDCEQPFSYASSIINARLEREVLDVITSRPAYTNLPRFLSQYGQYRCTFLLDFGSFRDLQRHRNGLCRMPLLTATLGFNSWYLQQLPNTMRSAAQALLNEQLAAIKQAQAEHQISAFDVQYYLPIGMNVYCELHYDLPEMVYVTELRSGKTVHPTLRNIAHQMGAALQKEHPQLALHAEFDPQDWDLQRGKQDIVEKTQ